MSTTPDTSAFVNAIACDLEEGGFRQVSGTTLRRTLATAVTAALPLLEAGNPVPGLAEQHGGAPDTYWLPDLPRPFAWDPQIGAPLYDGEQMHQFARAALAATGKQQVVEKEHWLDRMAAIEGRIEPSAREMEGMDEEQVGEVQGDALAHALEVLRVVTGRAMQGSETRLAYETVSAALARQQSAGKVVGHVSRDSSKAHMCVDLPEGSPLYALAARQPVPQVPYGFVLDWKHAPAAFTTKAGVAAEHRDYKNCNVVPVFRAPPAQGIDLGKVHTAVESLLAFADHHESCGDSDSFNNAEFQTCGCGFDSAREQVWDALDGQRDAAPGVRS